MPELNTQQFEQTSFPGVPKSTPPWEREQQPPARHEPTPLEVRQQRRETNREANDYPLRTYDNPEVSTSSFGLKSSYDKEYGAIPDEVSFHGSSKSAWRKVGHVEEVPIVGMSTPQGSVTEARVEQAKNDPATRQSPRFVGPPGFQELPKVYHAKGTYHIVDGNHRMTSAIAQGQMFQPARVVTGRQLPAMRKQREHIDELEARANAKHGYGGERRYAGHGLYGSDDYSSSPYQSSFHYGDTPHGHYSHGGGWHSTTMDDSDINYTRGGHTRGPDYEYDSDYHNTSSGGV